MSCLVGRSDVRCAFDVMALCDHEYRNRPDLASACRQGARDAHLTGTAAPSCHSDAYLEGVETTQLDCPNDHYYHADDARCYV